MENTTDASCDEVEMMLSPYVDGEATGEMSDTVKRHVGHCVPCGRRLSAERTARHVLQARRPALRVTAPAGLASRCEPSRPGRSVVRRWVPLSLAASLLLAVAGVLVYTVTDPVSALAAELAIDHLKCFKLQDTSGRRDPAELVRQWQASQGWELPTALAVLEGGLRLEGIRSCLSTEGRMAHLLYASNGRSVSVYVWREGEVPHQALEAFGQREVIWSDGGRMFAVVGAEDAVSLERVAATVRQAVGLQ